MLAPSNSCSQPWNCDLMLWGTRTSWLRRLGGSTPFLNKVTGLGEAVLGIERLGELGNVLVDHATKIQIGVVCGLARRVVPFENVLE